MERYLSLLKFLSLIIIPINSETLTFLGGNIAIESMAVYEGWNAREKATINFQFKTANPQGLC